MSRRIWEEGASGSVCFFRKPHLQLTRGHQKGGSLLEGANIEGMGIGLRMD